MFLLWLRQLPWCGDQTSASVPHQPRSSPVLLTLLFFLLVPSSYRVLHVSIYFFPRFKYSRLLSAGVLHAFLCLKVYSWCIHEERFTPRPPTPPSSSTPQVYYLNKGLCSISWVMSYTLFQVRVFTNLGDDGQASSLPKSHAGGLVGLHWPDDLLPPSPNSLQVILSP